MIDPNFKAELKSLLEKYGYSIMIKVRWTPLDIQVFDNENENQIGVLDGEELNEQPRYFD